MSGHLLRGLLTKHDREAKRGVEKENEQDGWDAGQGVGKQKGRGWLEGVV